MSRASSSEPSTGIGRSSPVAATRSVASVSCCTGRRPVRATADPASAASATPTPPIAGSATPSRVSTARVASSRCPITSARPCPASTATTRYCTRPSVAVRTDDVDVATGHRQLLLAQRRRRRRAPRRLGQPVRRRAGRAGCPRPRARRSAWRPAARGSTSSLCAAAVARCSRFASSEARMFCRTMKNATTDTRITAPAAARRRAPRSGRAARRAGAAGTPQPGGSPGLWSRGRLAQHVADAAHGVDQPRLAVRPRSCAAGSRRRPPARCRWSGSRSPRPARGSARG